VSKTIRVFVVAVWLLQTAVTFASPKLVPNRITLEYFDSTNDPALAGSFLVALHGSTKRTLRRGYSVVRIQESAGGSVQNFITGFFDGTKINGRPADIFSFGNDAFLLTDDHSGVVYYVYRK
jgi:glucose/arabinose dehydrogenase